MATLVRDPAAMSKVEQFLGRFDSAEDQQVAIEQFYSRCTAEERETFKYAWNGMWARPAQQLPGDPDWDGVFWRAGRGFGKTRTGAEGVRQLVNEGKARAVLIIGPTAADARDVMIEAPTAGLLAVHPENVRPVYKPSVRTLEWPNGAIGHVRSAEEPDSIRGPNSDLVWGDEPASWKYGKEAWDNAMLGLRLGRPHWLLTGTPRPLEWLRKLEENVRVRVRTGSTYDNLANLARQFIDMIIDQYENTRLALQELHAQYLDDVEGALWRLATIELSRFQRPFNRRAPWQALAELLTLEHRAALGLGAWSMAPGDARRAWRTVVGVDPPGETAECGIVVATAPTNAKAARDHAVVLADRSLAGPPELWGAEVVRAVQDYDAELCVVEANQGGDMVRSTIHAVDPNVRVDKIRAVDSKADRAEPISVLYSKGWVHHDGVLARLENQMTTWVADESASPDRLDAAVHVLTYLLRPTPRSGSKARAFAPA